MPSPQCLAKPTSVFARWLLIVLTLLPLLSGCASPPSVPVPSAEAPRLPPLPMQARQPPVPDWCSLTLSACAVEDLSNWQSMLTEPQPPAQPASAPTTK